MAEIFVSLLTAKTFSDGFIIDCKTFLDQIDKLGKEESMKIQEELYEKLKHRDSQFIEGYLTCFFDDCCKSGLVDEDVWGDSIRSIVSDRRKTKWDI